MIKTQLFIALGAVAALATTANAQTIPDNGDGVHLKKNPSYDEFFPFLHPNETQEAGTRLKMSKSSFVLEIVRQDSGQALRQLANVLGVHIVIDPEIKFLPAKTRTFQTNEIGEDLFNYISDAVIRGEPVEKWKSSAGTYFFAAKPAPVKDPTLYYQMPDGTYKRADGLAIVPGDGLRLVPPPFNGAPFSGEPDDKSPRIDPDFTWPKNFGTIQPLPNWEKREFNGNPYYHMPLPIPVPDSSDGIYTLPLPKSGSPDKPLSNPYVLPLPQRGPVK